MQDAVGTAHHPCEGTPRIVSLVPSLTELLWSLGLGAHLVGRTGFCVHPREALRQVPKVGGTKTLRMARLRALKPSHVLVNVDENRREDVAAIAEFCPHVVVTHPLRPEDNLQLYALCGHVFRREAAAAALAGELEAALGALREAARAWPREPVLYLVWREPWMSVARDTYISAMLAAAGWDTLPRDGTRRYPELDDEHPAWCEARRILLPTEPYRFGPRDAAALVRRHPHTAVTPIDGEMTSWYGSRAIAGLRYLAALRARLGGGGLIEAG